MCLCLVDVYCVYYVMCLHVSVSGRLYCVYYVMCLCLVDMYCVYYVMCLHVLLYIHNVM